MFIVGVFFDNGVNLQKVKTMLLHKSTLFTIVTTKTTLVVLMMNMEYINNYMLGATTTALVAVICYILINTCFYCLLIMTYKSIQWIENEMVHEITEMQLEYQKQLYKKQNECEGLLRIYKHDYKSILENSVRFIENGEPEEARRLLMQTDDQLMQIIRKQSRNSNSLIVDVILSGLEEKCAQENIEFFGNCYIPEGIHISELEFSRIFNNMANNAYEACMRQDTKEYKWISFRSYVKDKKLVIYQKNSFNGIVRYEKEKLGTTKVDQKLHGIGMNSIQYTVEALDGMFMFKADQEKKVFEILIKIPLKQ
ncbi:MAG: GHKL domain-containing protein [bacterium]|nr:GHKL domain-containing protein [bacterium]